MKRRTFLQCVGGACSITLLPSLSVSSDIYQVKIWELKPRTNVVGWLTVPDYRGELNVHQIDELLNNNVVVCVNDLADNNNERGLYNLKKEFNRKYSYSLRLNDSTRLKSDDLKKAIKKYV